MVFRSTLATGDTFKRFYNKVESLVKVLVCNMALYPSSLAQIYNGFPA
jgi:hypothetical protein